MVVLHPGPASALRDPPLLAILSNADGVPVDVEHTLEHLRATDALMRNCAPLT